MGTAEAHSFGAAGETVAPISARTGDTAAVAGRTGSGAQTDAVDEICEEVERETFIPVTRFAIMERLTRSAAWPAGDAETARRFFQFLAAWRHQSYTERLLRLKEAYMPFSPDRDTVRATKYDPSDLKRMQRRLIKLVRCLLERANYRRIDKEMLDQIFTEDSAFGLDLEVDLSEFEEALLYFRGAGSKTIHQRHWKTLFLRSEASEIPTYQRLFLLLKLKPAETRITEIMQEEGCEAKKAAKLLKRHRRMLPEEVSSDFVYLKLFKKIPRADVQMLFPNTRVQFRPFDKVKLVLTAGGGTVASVASTVSKVLVAVNPIKAAFALIGLVGVVFRQVMKFFNQRNQYMMVLAQNLYFHNLADNRGVLTLLSDRAEEEDIKEEMLLYALLAKEPLMEEELGEAQLAIEQYLEHEFGVTIEFDLLDALGRLKADGVIIKGEDGTLRAMNPAEGCDHIDAMWDEYLNTADFFNSSEDAQQAA